MKPLAFLAIALVIAPGPASSLSTCPPLPCSMIEACTSAADWIAEGQLLDVFDDSRLVCDYDDKTNCKAVYDPRRIVLVDVKLMKGTVTVSRRGTMIVPEDYTVACMHRDERLLTQERIGHRIRLYGYNNVLNAANVNGTRSMGRGESFFFWSAATGKHD